VVEKMPSGKWQISVSSSASSFFRYPSWRLYGREYRGCVRVVFIGSKSLLLFLLSITERKGTVKKSGVSFKKY